MEQHEFREASSSEVTEGPVTVSNMVGEEDVSKAVERTRKLKIKC